MTRATTYGELAEALGVSKTKAHALVKELRLVKGPEGWDVEAARAAIAAAGRVSPEKGAPEAPAGPVSTAPGPLAAPPVVDRDVKPATETVDALAIVEAAVLRAKALLDQADPIGAPRALETVKKLLEELRRTRAGELDLDERRGELVSIDDVRAVGAKVGRKFVEALERLEARLAPQLELWLADKVFRELDSAERARSVRKWIAGQTSVARAISAEEISTLLAAEVA